jgi:hypothetical protein
LQEAGYHERQEEAEMGERWQVDGGNAIRSLRPLDG